MLYRPRKWREEERKRGKCLKKAAWFRLLTLCSSYQSPQALC